MLIVGILMGCLIPSSVLEETAPDVVAPKRPEQSVLDTCQALQLDAQAIRREGYTALDKADTIREQAYRVKDEAFELKDEAYDIKESAMEARVALESTLVETLALMKSQATATNLYIQEIRSTLGALADRVTGIEDILEAHTGKGEQKLGNIEERLSALSGTVTGIEEVLEDHVGKGEQKLAMIQETLSEQSSAIRGKLAEQTSAINGKLAEQTSTIHGKLAEQTSAIEEKLAEQTTTLETHLTEQAAATSLISNQVSETLDTASKVRERQQTWLSEVRIISLYKVTTENNRHPDSFDSDHVADGQFTFDYPTHNTMRAYSHTASSNLNSKIWLHLGGLFRIHKIKIWNLRHSSSTESQLVGAHIYADDKLIGAVIQAKETYDFTVADDDPTYARVVTLHQPLAKHIHILELQVWGCGPFSEEDHFA